MKIFIVGLIFTFSCYLLNAQSDSLTATREIQKFQEELNKEYRDKESSPLKPADVKKFKHHSFYPVNLKYRVIAKLQLTPDSTFFPMKATGNIIQEYRIYGIANFIIDGIAYTLPVYQSKSLMKTSGYEDYLFLPFTDATNGEETYGGGRYIELRIPKQGDEITIDFNKAYNPYCAYSDRYSCPIVPELNHLPIPILAGVRLIKKFH